jgi:hypothetical protein
MIIIEYLNKLDELKKVTVHQEDIIPSKLQNSKAYEMFFKIHQFLAIKQTTNTIKYKIWKKWMNI